MGQISVLQYRDMIVTSAVAEELLAEAYFRMKADGNLPIVYYDRVPTLLEFLNVHTGQNAERIVLGCFREETGKPLEFCGFGWSMNPMVVGDKRKADCGFCFFKGPRRVDTVAFGRMMLGCFFQVFSIDALFGMTPEDNKLAVRYIKRVGMSLHGPVPEFASWDGKPTGAWISHISKEQFAERDYLEGAKATIIEEGQ
tara:strand:- start:16684 stop:17277 length:594 start_codon:yes stop_codon:yes gene_type:complete